MAKQSQVVHTTPNKVEQILLLQKTIKLCQQEDRIMKFKKSRTRKIEQIIKDQNLSKNQIMAELLLLLNSSIKGLEEIGVPKNAADRMAADKLKYNYEYAISQIQKRYNELDAVKYTYEEGLYIETKSNEDDCE